MATQFGVKKKENLDGKLPLEVRKKNRLYEDFLVATFIRNPHHLKLVCEVNGTEAHILPPFNVKEKMVEVKNKMKIADDELEEVVSKKLEEMIRNFSESTPVKKLGN